LIRYRIDRIERKRVAIEVNPDLSIVIKAPPRALEVSIRSAVRSNARWILRQQRFFADLLPKTPRRRLVSGESHLYLGRKYRLRVRDGAGAVRVTLSGGYLRMFVSATATPRQRASLLREWYLRNAQRVLRERFEACRQHPAFCRVGEIRVIVRRMKRRWGSCTPKRNLVLNTELIRASRACIDYVVTHELCHLLVPDHSRRFTNLLDRVMPDWRDRKRQLERMLS
jgi:predicted metal-dependent hydrolase